MGVVKFPTGSLGFHALLKHTGKENRRGPKHEPQPPATQHEARKSSCLMRSRCYVSATRGFDLGLVWVTGSSTNPRTLRQNSLCQSQFPENRRRKHAFYRRRSVLPLTTTLSYSYTLNHQTKERWPLKTLTTVFCSAPCLSPCPHLRR